MINHVAALRFFFVKTLKRHEFREYLPYPKDHRRLPTVLSPRGSRAAHQCRRNICFDATLLMTLYGTGMRRTEVAHLKVSDIDSQRMMIRVVAAKAARIVTCLSARRCWKPCESTGAGESQSSTCFPAANSSACRGTADLGQDRLDRM